MSCLQNILHPILLEHQSLDSVFSRLNGFINVTYVSVTESQTLFFAATRKEGRGKDCLPFWFVRVDLQHLIYQWKSTFKDTLFRTCLIKGSNSTTEWDMISSPNRPRIYGYTALLCSTRTYQTRLDNYKNPLYSAAW